MRLDVREPVDEGLQSPLPARSYFRWLCGGGLTGLPPNGGNSHSLTWCWLLAALSPDHKMGWEHDDDEAYSQSSPVLKNTPFLSAVTTHSCSEWQSSCAVATCGSPNVGKLGNEAYCPVLTLLLPVYYTKNVLNVNGDITYPDHQRLSELIKSTYNQRSRHISTLLSNQLTKMCHNLTWLIFNDNDWCILCQHYVHVPMNVTLHTKTHQLVNSVETSHYRSSIKREDALLRFHQKLFIRSALHLAGKLLRTRGSPASSVK